MAGQTIWRITGIAIPGFYSRHFGLIKRVLVIYIYCFQYVRLIWSATFAWAGTKTSHNKGLAIYLFIFPFACICAVIKLGSLCQESKAFLCVFRIPAQPIMKTWKEVVLVKPMLNQSIPGSYLECQSLNLVTAVLSKGFWQPYWIPPEPPGFRIDFTFYSPIFLITIPDNKSSTLLNG